MASDDDTAVIVACTSIIASFGAVATISTILQQSNWQPNKTKRTSCQLVVSISTCRHVEIDLAGWQQVAQPEKVVNLLANLRTSSTTIHI